MGEVGGGFSLLLLCIYLLNKLKQCLYLPQLNEKKTNKVSNFTLIGKTKIIKCSLPNEAAFPFLGENPSEAFVGKRK